MGPAQRALGSEGVTYLCLRDCDFLGKIGRLYEGNGILAGHYAEAQSCFLHAHSNVDLYKGEIAYERCYADTECN